MRWYPQPFKDASLGMMLTWLSSKAQSGLLNHPATLMMKSKLPHSTTHNLQALVLTPASLSSLLSSLIGSLPHGGSCLPAHYHNSHFCHSEQTLKCRQTSFLSILAPQPLPTVSLPQCRRLQGLLTKDMGFRPQGLWGIYLMLSGLRSIGEEIAKPLIKFLRR